MRARDLWVLFAAAALSRGDSCGGSSCPPVAMPLPMSEARAHALDPQVTTGVAFSTTHVFGDCRLDRARNETDACGHTVDAACATERADLLVLIVPVNTSVPVAGECAGGFRVADLAKVAVVDKMASTAGELVHAVDPGRYLVEVSADGRCALCGLLGAVSGCLIDVVKDQLTVRDLVLDESAH